MKESTRLNRTTYLLGEILIGLLALPLAYIAEKDPSKLESSPWLSFAALAFIILVFYYLFKFAARRFNDIGLSKWWAVARLIPGSQIALALIPGSKGKNAYGPEPKKHFDFNALF